MLFLSTRNISYILVDRQKKFTKCGLKRKSTCKVSYLEWCCFISAAGLFPRATTLQVMSPNRYAFVTFFSGGIASRADAVDGFPRTVSLVMTNTASISSGGPGIELFRSKSSPSTSRSDSSIVPPVEVLDSITFLAVLPPIREPAKKVPLYLLVVFIQ